MILKVSASDGLVLGAGFDFAAMESKPSPFTPHGNQVNATTDNGTTVDFYVLTESQALNTLKGFNVNATFRTPFVAGGANVNKLNQNTIEEGKFHLVIVAKHDYGQDRLNQTVLTPEAKNLIATNKHAEFAELYGTHFVRAEHKVARVVCELTVDRWSQETIDKVKVVAGVGGGFGPWGGEVKTTIQDDVKKANRRNSVTIKLENIGGEGLKDIGDLVSVALSEEGDIQKNIGDALKPIFARSTRANAGIGSVTVESYETQGWNPVAALLWSDEFETKLKKCAGLFRSALDTKQNIDTVRQEQGNGAGVIKKLDLLSTQYEKYLDDLRAFGKRLLAKDAEYVKADKAFPDAPKLDPETEAKLFARYARVIERLESLESALKTKNDAIEIKTVSVPHIVPKEEIKVPFERPHAHYEVFVSDIDLTCPNGDAHEINRFIVSAEVVPNDAPAAVAKLKYKLLMKHSSPNLKPFFGKMKLIVVGY